MLLHFWNGKGNFFKKKVKLKIHHRKDNRKIQIERHHTMMPQQAIPQHQNSEEEKSVNSIIRDRDIICSWNLPQPPPGKLIYLKKKIIFSSSLAGQRIDTRGNSKNITCSTWEPKYLLLKQVQHWVWHIAQCTPNRTKEKIPHFCCKQAMNEKGVAQSSASRKHGYIQWSRSLMPRPNFKW